ncbi:MAG TPA: hypothetical protein VHF22_03995, partial [Planctomycetota bacterium]|nr:hypothetical protein [Planctomycetota bacterium]
MTRPQTSDRLPETRLARGLTLVEMLLVVFILAAVAATAVQFVGNADDQARFDDTRTRLELIRAATVGRPDRTVNGEPDLAGFVADMGRLPTCVAELVEPGGMPAYTPPGVPDAEHPVGRGWRGPYVQGAREQSGALVTFRDGWANVDAEDPGEDARNFGWLVPPPEDALVLTSKGADGFEGPPADAPTATAYNVDDTLALGPDAWRVEGETVAVEVAVFVTATALPASDLDIRATLYYPSDGAVATVSSERAVVAGSLPAGGRSAISFSLGAA